MSDLLRSHLQDVERTIADVRVARAAAVEAGERAGCNRLLRNLQRERRSLYEALGEPLHGRHNRIPFDD